DDQHKSTKAMHTKTDGKVDALAARTTEIEQTIAQRQSYGGGRAETLGSQVAGHERFKQFAAAGFRGSARIPITAALTTLTTFPAVDQQSQIVGLPRQRLTVRNLLAGGT